MEVCLKLRQDFPSLEMDKPAIWRLGMETSSHCQWASLMSQKRGKLALKEKESQNSAGRMGK